MGGSKKGLPLLVFSSGEELVHGDGVCGECMSAEAVLIKIPTLFIGL